MKHLISGLTRALALATLFAAVFASELTQAATTSSPAVTKGLTWLQAQVQAGGSLSNEALSIATPLQNRAESLQTFKLLATVPGALADQLAADTQGNTEYLSRRAMELNLAGRDASAITALLLARQNLDGGFSGDTNYGSNALDTAWVMLALAQNNLATTAAAQSARGYLLSTIQTDGGVGTGSDSARINASALSLIALQMFPQDLASATALKQINSWLLLKQGADGSWLGNSNLTALALAAVSPLISDPTISTTATTYLTALQGVDGSWGGGDPFLTSVVLRALSGSVPATAAATSAITGIVVDQATTTPLAGATVALSGASTATITTAADGKINFTGLPAGSYTLQITSAGYNAYTSTYQLNTAQTLNVGTIALAQVLTSGIVTGTATDGNTGRALAGVTVLVNAASAVTDANGFYKIAGVTAGAVSLSASVPGYAVTASKGNVLGGQTLIFSPVLYAIGAAVPTTGTFSGKVVASGTGLPLGNVNVLLNGAIAGVTAADGTFKFTLAPGPYTAAFVLAGYNSATAAFFLTAGSNLSTGTISLIPQLTTTTISGVVKDAVSGNPINAAQVQALNGPVVTTGTNGVYTLAGLAGTSFSLRVSATGYVSQSLQLLVSQPTNFTQDFPLQVQTGLGLSLGTPMVSPASVGSRADVTAGTVVSNAATGSPTAVVLTMQVMNVAGQVIDTATPYDRTGSNALGQTVINPGQQLPVVFKWNTAQVAPGSYTLVANVVAAGSITRTAPLGAVLATAQGTLTITPSQHFSGTVIANPPVLQTGTGAPVQMSSVLSNDGNTDLPAQTYQLTITSQATSAVVATQQVNGTAFSPNALQSLAFTNWTPAAGGGQFQLDVQALGSASLGDATGGLYIGDAATGTFTVNQLAVPAGTQSLKGSIHVTGLDTTQGGQVVINTPLAARIMTAIQNAVTVNDRITLNWTLSTCTVGCHVQSQDLVGGELSRSFTTFDAATRLLVYNALATQRRQSNGATNMFQSPKSETMLSLWALNAWHNKSQPVVSTLVRAANYLLGAQNTDGSWTPDDGSGWWGSRAAQTAFNVKSFIAVRNTLTQTPTGTAETAAMKPWGPGNSISGAYKTMLSDPAGNIYVASCAVGAVSVVKSDGTVQQLMSGLTPTISWLPLCGMAFGADGSLYVATGKGLMHRALDGSVITVTAQPGIGLTYAPDGNFYMTSNDNGVYRVTPQGVTTLFARGGYASWGYPFNGPISITTDAAGNLLIGGMYDIPRVAKFSTQGAYLGDAAKLTNWYPYYIQPLGSDFLVATSSGLFRYNSEGEGERLPLDASLSSFYTVAATPNGNVFVGDANSVYQVQITPVNVPTQLAALDQGIANGVNWLLVDGNIDPASNLDLAHRLIGLGEANKYYAGTALASTIQSKMASIGSLLRSRQRADGGWDAGVFRPVWYSWGNHNTSDSLVTAQVGVALDYLNPSSSDPVVQNAIQLLLSRQAPNGTWSSENGIFLTPVATTTWVAIYLPVALNRVTGGINTDLSVSMPANVTLANPSMTPASSVANTAGGTDYLWHLQGVKTAGVDVGFDLTLQNMVLGETRPVASNAYLTFNNSFTGQPTIGPITVPRVTASAFLGVGVTTDQVSYGANAPVNITAAVNNTSAAGLLDGSVRLEIYAADNSLVAVVGTPLPFTGLAPGVQTSLGGTWNTGTLAAGGYYVLASLYDAQNRLAGTAKSAFTVTAGIGSSAPAFTGVGAAVSVDKQSYQPYDRVQITSRISNLTQNLAFSGLQAVITAKRPDGSVLLTQSTPLQQLLAAGFIDLPSSTQLASAAAGQYPVTLSVQNAAAVELARAATGFTVQSTANTGNGLRGTVGALPKIVPQTDSVILSWTASNLGNADFAALPVKLTVFDPLTLQLLTQQAYTIPLIQGQTYQTAFSWDTSPATVGATYVVVLAATVGGKDIVLAQDAFLVTDPPVRLGVSQSTVRENRVLVWLACAAGQDPNSATQQDGARASDGAQSKAYADSKGQGGNKVRDGQDKPDTVSLCLQTRTAFLQGVLGGLNVPYLITTKRDDFRNAFREGRYNVYWLSGDISLSEDAAQSDKNRRGDKQGGDTRHRDGRAHPEDSAESLLKEVREAVFRGDSLIQDGPQHGDLLQEAAGLSYAGQLPGINLALNTAGLLFPAQPLLTNGRPLSLRTAAGTAQATFVVPANGDDRQRGASGDANAQQNSDGTQKPDGQNNGGQNNGKRDNAQSNANQNADAQGNNAQGKDGQSDGGQNPDAHATAHPSDDAHQPAPVWPGIVSNQYGRGHALTFGFDLVDTLQNSAAPAAWSTLLQTGFGWLMPPLPNPYSGGAYVQFDTDIQNLARSVDLSVASYLPQGATLLQTVPLATLDANGQPSWLFTLPQAATQTLLVDMRLPFASGNQKALTTIDSIRNGKTRRYASYNYAWQVAASDTLPDQISTDLSALTLSNDDEIEARAAALSKLQLAVNAIGQARYSDAIAALLGAVEQVRKITSVDTSAIRLNLDSMLQETEWNWLRTGGATAAPASAPDHPEAHTQDTARGTDAQQPTQAAHK